MSIIQMSMSGAILILAIIIIRQLAIHRLPKKTFMVFWGVVLLRLLIPFSFNLSIPMPAFLSAEAIINNVTGLGAEIGDTQNTGVIPNILPRTDITEAVNAFNATLPDIPESNAIFSITAIWALGIFAVALFVLVTHLRSRREYNASLPADNFYINKWLDEQRGMRHIQARQSDRITAPLTYGILKPVILFPKTTDWQDVIRLRYILTH